MKSVMRARQNERYVTLPNFVKPCLVLPKRCLLVDEEEICTKQQVESVENGDMLRLKLSQGAVTARLMIR